MMTAEMLEDLGHRVIAEAGSISVAEPLARTAEFDLAVLDINVGGTNIILIFRATPQLSIAIIAR